MNTNADGRTMDAKAKAKLAQFFLKTYRRAQALDPREMKDTEDLARALISLRGGRTSWVLRSDRQVDFPVLVAPGS